MRLLPYPLVLCLGLSGCRPRISSEQRQSYSDMASECIQREATIIAHTKVDLETAATAVLARCNSELAAERNYLPTLYPGYRDYMEPRLRELDTVRIDQARKRIALLRTSIR